MAKADITVTRTASSVVAGQIIRLNDGTLAEVVDVGKIDHTIKQEVPVRVLRYRLTEGRFKGAELSTPLLGGDEIDVVPEKKPGLVARFWKKIKERLL